MPKNKNYIRKAKRIKGYCQNFDCIKNKCKYQGQCDYLMLVGDYEPIYTLGIREVRDYIKRGVI